MSAAPKPCRICIRTRPARSNKSAPTALTISGNATTRRSKQGAKAAIPPRKGAKIWQRANSKAERHVRDENLRRIRKVGRKQWKRESNYHRRSLAADSGLSLQDDLWRSVANSPG